MLKTNKNCSGRRVRWRIKQQDDKIMTFGNKNILAWDKQWNMTALLITTVHSRLIEKIILEKSLYKLLLQSLPAVSLFQCYAQLQWDSSIPRHTLHIKPCVSTGRFSFFCFSKAWNYRTIQLQSSHNPVTITYSRLQRKTVSAWEWLHRRNSPSRKMLHKLIHFTHIKSNRAHNKICFTTAWTLMRSQFPACCLSKMNSIILCLLHVRGD